MTATVNAADEHFDPYDPEFSARYHQTLASMRERCPVTHSDRHGGFWVVTRYEDVRRVILDWETFTSVDGLSIPPNDQSFRMPPIETDPPEQRYWRQMMNYLMTPAKVAKHEPGMRAVATALIDSFIERGSCDLSVEFARPYPGTIFFAEMLGIARDNLSDVLSWTHVVSFESNSPELPHAFGSLFAFCAEQLSARQASGERQEDLVDALLYGELAGHPAPFERKVAALIMLIIGGLDTSANLIGNIMNILGHDVLMRDSFRENPDRWPEAIEEFLRFDGPISGLARTATRDIEIGGHLIRKGEKLLCHYGSANRDPHEFEHPEELDFGRNTNRHMGFGVGVHRCVGSNLARLQVRVALEEILRRMPDIRVDPEGAVKWNTGMSHGVCSLPVLFTSSRPSA